MPAGVHGTGPGIDSARRPRLSGCRPSTSLSGSSVISAASKSMCAGGGYWKSTASTASSALSAAIASSTSDWVASTPRWTSTERHPRSAAIVCLLATYRALASSSPTSSVASPGTCPCSRSFSIRGARSAKTASATGPPGIITALTIGTPRLGT